MFATSYHFHPDLIFVGKTRSQLLVQTPVWGSTLAANLACTYETRVEVTENGKHSSLNTELITTVKSFMVEALGRNINVLVVASLWLSLASKY